MRNKVHSSLPSPVKGEISELIEHGRQWFASRGQKPHAFQEHCWEACLQGQNGLLNAPTGSGKTYAMFIGWALDYKRRVARGEHPTGMQVLWITPLRALAKDIRLALEVYCNTNEIPWRVAVRTGDTATTEREKQRRKPPEVLITTPESLHLMLGRKGYPQFFQNLRVVVCDEWHELMGSKRGVLMELALSRLIAVTQARVWGVSATIGNIEQAMEVLLGEKKSKNSAFIRADMPKETQVHPFLPDSVDELPWAGHLGIKMLEKALPVIAQSESTILFTNTRAQSEIWYQRLLAAAPELAGAMAMHHGSIDRDLRDWVEDALHAGRLKLVVSTSSLDLGVDFRPVDTVIQVGGPKSIARFMQRAGRSGHRPGEVSHIWFMPTHSLELLECAALREAMALGEMEDRIPYVRSYDVLLQYLVTLSLGEGFVADEIYREVCETHCFLGLSTEEWNWVMAFLTGGGKSLHAYEEYKKIVLDPETGRYRVANRRLAMRHRMNIGAIVSDSNMVVKFATGGYLGTVEEWFISRLEPGDVFWFAGRSLELVRVKDMTAEVKRSNRKTGLIPSWQGGRMPLSSQMAHRLRMQLERALEPQPDMPEELRTVLPVLQKQQERSHLPREDEFLIEVIESREGHHLFFFPFEGRLVHEGMCALLAYRFSLLRPITFSMAYNDYGFELLSDQEIPLDEALDNNLFTTDHLLEDVRNSLNHHEMARRRFRDIAGISGLVFSGYPGKPRKERHLQASSSLFFDVFREYEPDNLLLQQAYNEVLEFQIEESRLRQALNRFNSQRLIITYPEKPTPFSFPILVDRLREKLSSEQLEERIRRMTQ